MRIKINSKYQKFTFVNLTTDQIQKIIDRFIVLNNVEQTNKELEIFAKLNKIDILFDEYGGLNRPELDFLVEHYEIIGIDQINDLCDKPDIDSIEKINEN